MNRRESPTSYETRETDHACEIFQKVSAIAVFREARPHDGKNLDSEDIPAYRRRVFRNGPFGISDELVPLARWTATTLCGIAFDCHPGTLHAMGVAGDDNGDGGNKQ